MIILYNPECAYYFTKVLHSLLTNDKKKDSLMILYMLTCIEVSLVIRIYVWVCAAFLNWLRNKSIPFINQYEMRTCTCSTQIYVSHHTICGSGIVRYSLIWMNDCVSIAINLLDKSLQFHQSFSSDRCLLLFPTQYSLRNAFVNRMQRHFRLR